MPSLKVAHRLLLGFLALLLLVAGLGWAGHATGRWQADRLGALHAGALDAADHAAGMAVSARAVQSAAQAILAQRLVQAAAPDEAAPNRAAEPSARHALAEGVAAFERHLAQSRALAAEDGRAAAERVAAIEGAFGTYRHAATRFAESAEGAAAFEVEVRVPFEDVLAPLLARHQAATQAALGEHVAAAQTARTWGSRLLLLGAFVVLLAALFIGVTLTRYVDRGLSRAVTSARAIAAGRLTNPIRVASDDEFGDLAEALNEMVARLSTATVSKTYVENIVQSMADPLVVVDPDVRIAMVNQALLDLLGYEAEELVGASVTRIFAHAGRQRGAAIKQDIERGLAGNIDSTFRTKAGQEVTISLSSALVRAGGEVQGLVIVAKDITEQKRREKELIEAKDEAERMVQLRDAFLANMSHEIRTPLTGILGSAQVLAEVVEGEHRNLAKIIEDAGHRLLDTINSVLEMARIEAGEVQPEMEVLDFAEEAEMVANVLRPLAEKKGLALKVYAQTSGGRVAAQLDRTCLNRILNNLVGNAIKFTKEGAVSIEISADGDDAVLTVRDTGIGIGKEFVPYLFDDFKQESTGLGRNHEGSGLGLAITKKLVDMMGGTISVESVKGLGSAFTARFERVPVEEAAAYASDGPVAPLVGRAPGELWSEPEADLVPTFGPPPAPAERTPRDLLLIEDNQQNAYMARFMLEGYSADIATTPEEALALAARHQYGVLLVDINLGTDTSGIDLLREFRQMEGYETTAAVAVTAYALPGDKERFLQEGFDDYVSKPYRKETLREAVERALATAQPPAPVADLDVVLGGSFEEPAETPAAPAPEAARPDAYDDAFSLPDDGAPDSLFPSAPPPPTAPAEEFLSPDEFLPADYRPPSAFSHDAADLVERAERERDAHGAFAEVGGEPEGMAAGAFGSLPAPSDDDPLLSDDDDAPRGAGDGAGGAAGAPGR